VRRKPSRSKIAEYTGVYEKMIQEETAAR